MHTSLNKCKQNLIPSPHHFAKAIIQIKNLRILTSDGEPCLSSTAQSSTPAGILTQQDTKVSRIRSLFNNVLFVSFRPTDMGKKGKILHENTFTKNEYKHKIKQLQRRGKAKLNDKNPTLCSDIFLHVVLTSMDGEHSNRKLMVKKNWDNDQCQKWNPKTLNSY